VQHHLITVFYYGTIAMLSAAEPDVMLYYGTCASLSAEAHHIVLYYGTRACPSAASLYGIVLWCTGT